MSQYDSVIKQITNKKLRMRICNKCKKEFKKIKVLDIGLLLCDSCWDKKFKNEK